MKWSPSGDIFALSEKETSSISKQTWTTYMITSYTETRQGVNPQQMYTKWKGKMMKVQQTNQAVSHEVEVFEFKKTARHESNDAKTTVVWDDFGKAFVIHGEKATVGPFDKEKRSIRFFTMYGEPLLTIDRLPEMNHFSFRPRPNNLLNKNQTVTLKKTYRKTYKKTFKEEEKSEKATANETMRTSKKKIRDEFLNDFYIPNRKAYDDNIDKFIAIWPIKDDDLTPEPVAVNHIFHYGEVT